MISVARTLLLVLSVDIARIQVNRYRTNNAEPKERRVLYSARSYTLTSGGRWRPSISSIAVPAKPVGMHLGQLRQTPHLYKQVRCPINKDWYYWCNETNERL